MPISFKWLAFIASFNCIFLEAANAMVCSRTTDSELVEQSALIVEGEILSIVEIGKSEGTGTELYRADVLVAQAIKPASVAKSIVHIGFTRCDGYCQDDWEFTVGQKLTILTRAVTTSKWVKANVKTPIDAVVSYCLMLFAYEDSRPRTMKLRSEFIQELKRLKP
jgi:hypothetical protein